MSTIDRKGFMFVLSSPSGAGKTTISRMLLEHDDNLVMSISVTTRPKRPQEVEGRDYSFVSREQFGKMVSQGDFLESAQVFGHFYGTPKSKVISSLESGKDVLFDIDWQGTRQLSESSRDDVVSIFILPPSMAELEKRLYKRAQDEKEVIEMRLAKANHEISHWNEYDYVVINHDLEDSLNKVLSILHAERLKRTRQQGLHNFVQKLLFN